MSSRDGHVSVLVAPDKFKGSLTAAEVANRIALGLTDEDNRDHITCELLPLADGGDGSVDAAIAAGFTSLTFEVSGPTGHPVSTTVAFDGNMAIVEVATTSGLGALPSGQKSPLDASSYGVGQAIRHVIDLGATRIVVALGGSASTDGGAGMLAALGARFLDEDGEEIQPSGGNLRIVSAIDMSAIISLTHVELVGASDVTNPLTGIRGAAHVFGPQKGADTATVEDLDAALIHLAERAEAAGLPQARAAKTAPGAGSAGGIGYAILLLGGGLVSGAEFFLNLLDFDRRVAASDVVITGEGSMDEQTKHGKLISVVTERSGSIPVIAVVGRNTLTTDGISQLGLTCVYALTDRTDEDSSRDAALSARLLTDIGRSIARTLVPARNAAHRQTPDLQP